jgi:Metal-dependent hydrolases of the beta-lactamase superfamily I
MSLRFCSFSSGSSGNCYLIRSDTSAVLVDAGISGKRIMEGLAETETDPSMLKGIVITHEHSDHVRGLRIAAKRCPGASVYSNENTWEKLEGLVEEDRQEIFESGSMFDIGDIGVKSFRTSHDAAEPVGFSFYCNDRQISIVTDTGYVSDDIIREISGADILSLEANHEPDVLKSGRYPYYLKRRILGDKGHLSNEAAAECIIRIEEQQHKDREILLAHLSSNNNTPELAAITVKNILEDAGLQVGSSLRVDVVMRDRLSRLYEV